MKTKHSIKPFPEDQKNGFRRAGLWKMRGLLRGYLSGYWRYKDVGYIGVVDMVSVTIPVSSGRFLSRLDPVQSRGRRSRTHAPLFAHYFKPWYQLRISAGQRLIRGAPVCEVLWCDGERMNSETVCRYYPRFRDFVRHVRVYGFPRLFCPELINIERGICDFLRCFQK